MEINLFRSWFGGNRSTDHSESLESLRRELEGQLSALHNAALVSETDLKGNITFVNDTFCQVSGYSRDELMGQNHRILKSGHQSDDIFRDLWRTISQGKPWQGEVKNKKKDGSYYWVWATITPVLNPETQRPEKYISVRFEITQQKELEAQLQSQVEEMRAQDEELRQSMEELRSTSENLERTKRELEFIIKALDNAAIVSATDVKGNIIYVNDKFCEISQYSREELMGQNHRILKSGHHPDEVFRDMWRTIARGEYWQGLVKNKKKDGTYYWVVATITPMLGPDGKPERYISVRTEITSEIEKEEALQQHVEELHATEEELRATMEQVHTMNDNLLEAQHELNNVITALNNAAIVSTTDVKGNITYVNDTFCEISQYTREELIGQNHRILKSGHQPDEIFVDMWRTIANGNVWRGIVKNKKKDGTYYWVHTTITPVLDPNTRKPVKYIAVRVDITAEKEKDALLAESNQNIEQLNTSLALAKDALEKKLQARDTEIHESVRYAQRLQRAVLTPIEDLRSLLPPGYSLEVMFQPRDAVSGDFYWGGTYKHNRVLVLGDGSGHGVPGAFMTMLGISNLTKLVEERGFTDPAALLTEMDVALRHALQQDRDDLANSSERIMDSLEMAVLSFTEGTHEIRVGSAFRPLVLATPAGELEELLGNKKTVGGTQFLGDDRFSTFAVTLQPGETLYLFSDGYAHQLGGPTTEARKLGKTAFYDLLKQLAQVERMRDRTKALFNRLQDWKGFFRDQTDDVTVLMLRRDA
jgi:PAS domain S-box-containing protein